MSIFAKKQEWDQKTAAEGGGAPATTNTPAGRGGYGIAEAIQLLRGLPVGLFRGWRTFRSQAPGSLGLAVGRAVEQPSPPS